MDKKPLSQRSPKGSVIRIDSDQVASDIKTTRKKRPLFGSALGIATAVLASTPQLPNRGTRANLNSARHVSRAVLAGEPGSRPRSEGDRAKFKARRNHRRAMRNRMGYR